MKVFAFFMVAALGPQLRCAPKPPQANLSSPGGAPSPFVLAQRGCCACSSGGSLVSVPEKEIKSHEARLKSKCAESIRCPALYNCEEWRSQCEINKCSRSVLSQL